MGSRMVKEKIKQRTMSVKELMDKRFDFGQLTSNSDGKTSASGTAGLYIVAIGGISFIMGCIDKIWFSNSVDILNQSMIFTATGVALLSVKKLAKNTQVR